MPFDGVLQAAHRIVEQRLRPGDLAVDATCGNGHDTAFLAERVGQDGHVFGFDVQEAAILATRERLVERSLVERVTLVHAGHEHLRAYLAPSQLSDRRGLRACMFNLGYLPGSDRSVVTKPKNTVGALDAALDLLEPGGVLTVVLYAGHAGGQREAEAVMRWAERVDRRRADCLHYRFVNDRTDPPQLLACERHAP